MCFYKVTKCCLYLGMTLFECFAERLGENLTCWFHSPDNDSALTQLVLTLAGCPTALKKLKVQPRRVNLEKYNLILLEGNNSHRCLLEDIN